MIKQPKAKRVLKDVDVQFISLVHKGANQKTIVWKADDSAPTGEESSWTGDRSKPVQKTIAILKTDEEKRMVYGIVYAPDEVDSDGDTMTAGEIEKAAHAFMKAARTGQIDKQHNYQAGEGYIAESWIVRKSDELFTEEGAWAVGIKVENDETWQAVKKGEIGGLSLPALPTTKRSPKRSGPRTGPMRSRAC